MSYYKKNNPISILFFIIGVCFLSGCATTRHAVPSNLENEAFIPGMKEVRVFGDDPDKAFVKDLEQSFKQESSDEYRKGMFKVYPVLFLSGGGSNGAYGAGLLNGWSETGKRPKFKVITGISTGALISTFAFLGKDYDAPLKEFYTSYSTKDFVKQKGPLAIITGDSIENTHPLEKMFEKYFTKDVLKKIAQEHDKGRRLYIGTTNLDAQRLVVWNMGKIAQIGDDQAVKLFRKILIASSAIPVAFPPVFFDVQADGKQYEEMHVDGGTITQVFSLYDILQGTKEKKKVDIYLIWNGFVNPKSKAVKNKLSSIAFRALDTLVNNQGLSDIYRIYSLSEERKQDFHLAYIPVDFNVKSKQLFDPVQMTKLFELGYSKAIDGTAWKQPKPAIFETFKKNNGGI